MKKEKLINIFKIMNMEKIDNYELIDEYNANHNKYFIYKTESNTESKTKTELIINICGTDEIFDIFIDAYIGSCTIFKSETNKQLYTTNGIHIMYGLIKNEITNDIKSQLIKDNTITKISLIGHSLGGPLSTMLLLDLLYDNEFVKIIKKKIPENNSNINLINLITYNSPKFFATFDDYNKFDQPNTYINEFISSLGLTDNINIINMINNYQAPNIISYDFDHDLVSQLPRSNTIFKHIADKNNNIYLLNKKTNCIESVKIYDTNSKIILDEYETKKLNIINTIFQYIYYIFLLPCYIGIIIDNHKVFSEQNFDMDCSILPDF